MTNPDGALPSPAAPDDTAIVGRILAGDKRAFEHLMRRYNRRLYRLAQYCAMMRKPKMRCKRHICLRTDCLDNFVLRLRYRLGCPDSY
jgi:hypothetical protein